jgi:hypothetical protein
MNADKVVNEIYAKFRKAFYEDESLDKILDAVIREAHAEGRKQGLEWIPVSERMPALVGTTSCARLTDIQAFACGTTRTRHGTTLETLTGCGFQITHSRTGCHSPNRCSHRLRLVTLSMQVLVTTPEKENEMKKLSWPTLKVRGVARLDGERQALVIYFDREPSDAELINTHEYLRNFEPSQTRPVGWEPSDKSTENWEAS